MQLAIPGLVAVRDAAGHLQSGWAQRRWHYCLRPGQLPPSAR